MASNDPAAAFFKMLLNSPGITESEIAHEMQARGLSFDPKGLHAAFEQNKSFQAMLAANRPKDSLSEKGTSSAAVTAASVEAVSQVSAVASKSIEAVSQASVQAVSQVAKSSQSATAAPTHATASAAREQLSEFAAGIAAKEAPLPTGMIDAAQFKGLSGQDILNKLQGESEKQSGGLNKPFFRAQQQQSQSAPGKGLYGVMAKAGAIHPNYNAAQNFQSFRGNPQGMQGPQLPGNKYNPSQFAGLRAKAAARRKTKDTISAARKQGAFGSKKGGPSQKQKRSSLHSFFAHWPSGRQISWKASCRRKSSRSRFICCGNC